MTFAEFVVEVHRHLARARTGHAFGGALALAYVADPRGTVDVDVNVFVYGDRASSPGGPVALDVSTDLRVARGWVRVTGLAAS